MSIRFHSIFYKILFSFIIIIVFTVFLSTTIEYISSKSELPRLLTDIRSNNLAETLSAVYTRDQGWGMLRQEIVRLNSLDKINPPDKFLMRVVVKDSDNKTLYNSFADLTQSGNAPLIEGESVDIYDYSVFKAVGKVTVYISQAYLEEETGEYILDLFKPRMVQGLITILLALLVAAYFSHRITIPIKALTKATKVISDSGDSQILPVNSCDELGQMSESFNQMVRSLQIQRELRKRLISDVSHDINTPLNIIRLEAKGLSDGITTSDEAVEHIIEEVDTLSNLIHDLDWLAETDSGQFKLKLGIYSLYDTVKAEIERWRLKAYSSDIKLTIHSFPSGLPLVQMDVLRISQVLGNLLENSFKYTPPGGIINLSCRVENEEALISIRDSGPGIASDELPYIFERFVRIEKSRERSKGGRGLGLSIVKQIVELHKGRVWVESEINHGTCFHFTLPL
jgi:signal transduction histidine kinase